MSKRKGTITVTVTKTLDELGSIVDVSVDAQGVKADSDEITGLMFIAMLRVVAQTQAQVPADDGKGKTEH